ncbi:LysR family transcriptional regulator, partial [Klebsiella pneumoniae]
PHLDQGVLKRLPLSHGARRATPLHLIVKRDLAPIDEQVATLLALFRTP